MNTILKTTELYELKDILCDIIGNYISFIRKGNKNWGLRWTDFPEVPQTEEDWSGTPRSELFSLYEAENDAEGSFSFLWGWVPVAFLLLVKKSHLGLTTVLAATVKTLSFWVTLGTAPLCHSLVCAGNPLSVSNTLLLSPFSSLQMDFTAPLTFQPCLFQLFGHLPHLPPQVWHKLSKVPGRRLYPCWPSPRMAEVTVA